MECDKSNVPWQSDVLIEIGNSSETEVLRNQFFSVVKNWISVYTNKRATNFAPTNDQWQISSAQTNLLVVFFLFIPDDGCEYKIICCNKSRLLSLAKLVNDTRITSRKLGNGMDKTRRSTVTMTKATATVLLINRLT